MTQNVDVIVVGTGIVVVACSLLLAEVSVRLGMRQNIPFIGPLKELPNLIAATAISTTASCRRLSQDRTLGDLAGEMLAAAIERFSFDRT